MSQSSAKFAGILVGPTGSVGPIGPTGAVGPVGPQGSFLVTGQSIIDFGSPPGTNVVTTTITGQTGILSTSNVNAFMMADTTVTGAYGHNAEEHKIVPIKLSCGNIMVGTGFTIYAETDWRLDSVFNVRWLWS
jgi:hypothetical protein